MDPIPASEGCSRCRQITPRDRKASPISSRRRTRRSRRSPCSNKKCGVARRRCNNPVVCIPRSGDGRYHSSRPSGARHDSSKWDERAEESCQSAKPNCSNCHFSHNNMGYPSHLHLRDKRCELLRSSVPQDMKLRCPSLLGKLTEKPVA